MMMMVNWQSNQHVYDMQRKTVWSRGVSAKVLKSLTWVTCSKTATQFKESTTINIHNTKCFSSFFVFYLQEVDSAIRASPFCLCNYVSHMPLLYKQIKKVIIKISKAQLKGIHIALWSD